MSESTPLIETLLDLLPQTQCGQCGYPGCRPYAEALLQGEAINRCPPGGQSLINQLAPLLDKPVVAPDPTRGSGQPLLAFIREDECIGCTKCIQACPVDAILGAAKLMHTVIAAECTGCDLCAPRCPVDCIEMLPVTSVEEDQARKAKARHARQRYEQRQQRLERLAAEREAQRQAREAQLQQVNTAKPTAIVGFYEPPTITEPAIQLPDQTPAWLQQAARSPLPTPPADRKSRQLKQALHAAQQAVRQAEKSLHNLQQAADATAGQIHEQEQRLAAARKQLQLAETRLQQLQTPTGSP